MGDLIGKGIDALTFMRLLFYASMTVMPLAIILGILVASLMTFGNLAERLELLAMKAAGIPLLTIMKPLFVTVICIAAGLFIFQNDYMIKSQVSFWQYYFSIKNKSPELAIPEGVFYKDLENYSIYVERKDRDAKMMYGMMIYDLTNGFKDATVLMADSGKLYSTKKGAELILELYEGESFQNLKDDNSTYYENNAERPFLREKFKFKEIHIPFDASLSMVDASILSSQFVGKNLFELREYTDSIAVEIDSLAVIGREQVYQTEYMRLFSENEKDIIPSQQDQIARLRADVSDSTIEENQVGMAKDTDVTKSKTSNNDKIVIPPSKPKEKQSRESYSKLPKEVKIAYNLEQKMANIGLSQKSAIYETASTIVSNDRNENYFSVQRMDENVNLHRKNEFEYWRKFTYPTACIVFFLIGAPLGALIRKGGMGVPFITAVLFFIVFYILESFGWKMVREGTLVNWFGMWLPNLVLFPIGLWLCYVATKDSSRLNFEVVAAWSKRYFGTKTDRKIEYKEIVMAEANFDQAEQDILLLNNKIDHLEKLGTMHYWEFFLNDKQYEKREELNALVEQIVKNLENTRDYNLVLALGNYPFLRDLSRTMRLRSKIGNILLMLFLPFGLIVYVVYALRNKRYIEQLKKVSQANKIILDEIWRVKQNNISNAL